MKVQVPDSVVSYMVRKGMGPAEVERVVATVTEPSGVEIPEIGNHIILVGDGVKVTGHTDRTGKYFRVSRVDFQAKA
jgi:hypothetical protein